MHEIIRKNWIETEINVNKSAFTMTVLQSVIFQIIKEFKNDIDQINQHNATAKRYTSQTEYGWSHYQLVSKYS